MQTKIDNLLLHVADQLRLADSELGTIPVSSPSYRILHRLIISQRDTIEIIHSLRKGLSE